VLNPHHLGDHLDRLYRAAWALCGSREEAEDLVQDTYAHVLARPRFLRDDDDLGYLLRALRNTFVSRYRTAARRPRKADVEVEHVAVADEDHSIDPVAAVEAREVYTVIAELPDEFRDVLVAIDVVGLSYAETAKALRLRPGTVTSRLSRARGRVAASLMRAAGDDE
jgi:RNA polymerase sigma-70 factor (ECF subfamily)